MPLFPSMPTIIFLVITLALLVIRSLIYRSILTNEATTPRLIAHFVISSLFMFIGSAVLVGNLSILLALRSVGSVFFGLMSVIGVRQGKKLAKLE